MTALRTFLTLDAASAAHAAHRDALGFGASKMRDWRVVVEGVAYRISYNSKVWADKDWASGDMPAYSPYATVLA